VLDDLTNLLIAVLVGDEDGVVGGDDDQVADAEGGDEWALAAA
jgi:hypothetical protein